MPRYLIETADSAGSSGELAMQLVGRRFPEVSVERRLEADDGQSGPHEVWLCSAPSEAHIRRWAAAADLAVRSLSVATDGGESPSRPITNPGPQTNPDTITEPNPNHGGTP
jgi:hypothetical protein